MTTEELLKLLEDLVDSNPIAEVEDFNSPDDIVICACCLQELAEEEEDRKIEQHAETCPYRRAYEILESMGRL